MRKRENPSVPENIFSAEVIIQDKETAAEESTPIEEEEKHNNDDNKMLIGGPNLHEESLTCTHEQPAGVEEEEGRSGAGSVESHVESPHFNTVVTSEPQPKTLPNIENNSKLDKKIEINEGNISENVVVDDLSDSDIQERNLIKMRKNVSIDTVSECFSDQIVIEDLSVIEKKHNREMSSPADSETELDPSRFVSYPDDLRPSYRLPQRLTSRRSTMFLQSSLCCCQRTRERRDTEERGCWTSIFCCLRIK